MVDPRGRSRMAKGAAWVISVPVVLFGVFESATCDHLGCTFDAAGKIESLRHGDRGPGAVPEVYEISTGSIATSGTNLTFTDYRR